MTFGPMMPQDTFDAPDPTYIEPTHTLRIAAGIMPEMLGEGVVHSQSYYAQWDTRFKADTDDAAKEAAERVFASLKSIGMLVRRMSLWANRPLPHDPHNVELISENSMLLGGPIHDR